MDRLRFTILGCGSSGGVPRIGGLWGKCDPANPKNHRSRCSLLVERIGPGGVTRVLIDTSPDMRDQLLRAGVGTLDAVAYTHSHADHTHGIDDLRMVVFNTGTRLPVWADGATGNSLIDRFGYAFVQPKGSHYPPILDLHTIDGNFEVTGAGGALLLEPFRVPHGSIEALGFRIGRLAYLPDAATMSAEAWAAVTGLDVWILDALRRDPHPTHTNLATALKWFAQAGVGLGVTTNMHIDLDYDTLRRELPRGVVPAHDGMVIELAI